MANDSTTGGFLTPEGPPAPAPPASDLDLDKLFQATVAAITSIDGTLVRPRFQEIPPTQPPSDVNWCAVGVMTTTPDAGPYMAQLPAQSPSDDPSTQYIRHEGLNVLLSFYGPNAQANASLLRDGIAVPQNMEALKAQQISLTEVGPARNASANINGRFLRRWDVAASFRRKIIRVYGIKSFVDVNVHLFDDTGAVDRTILAPPPVSPPQS
jgi:hypothetical protein